MGTTEHLRGVRAFGSSWVPAALQAQLAEPAGCPSAQPPFSALLCQTSHSWGGKCWLRLTGDTMATLKRKQGILLQKNVIKQSSGQPLFLKVCIHCTNKKQERKNPPQILSTILSFMSIKFYLQKIKQFVCFLSFHNAFLCL